MRPVKFADDPDLLRDCDQGPSSMPAVLTWILVVQSELDSNGRLTHDASRCKRLVVEVGYVIG